MHLYITNETAAGWEAHHFSSALHAVPRAMVTGALEAAGFTAVRWMERAMVTGALEAAGFTAVRWMEPGESGYYQPVVLARLGGAAPSITTGRASHCKDPP